MHSIAMRPLSACVIRLQLDRRGGFRSVVRGQLLDLDCRHANLARHIQTRQCCAYHGGEEHHQQRAVRTLKECFHTLVKNDISVLMSLVSITPSLHHSPTEIVSLSPSLCWSLKFVSVSVSQRNDEHPEMLYVRGFSFLS